MFSRRGLWLMQGGEKVTGWEADWDAYETFWYMEADHSRRAVQFPRFQSSSF